MRILRFVLALAVCIAAAAPAGAKPKPGVLLQWSASPGAFKQKTQRLPTLEACEQAGLKLTLDELTRVYGERSSYADVPKKPRFSCLGPCVEMNGNATYCPVNTWDGEEEDEKADKP